MTSVPQTTPTANGATRPVPVSSFDWESGTYTYDVNQMDRHGIWRVCVATAATKAYSNMPESHSRIDKAIQLVLSEAVDLQADESALVRSSDGSKTYRVNGACECPDAEKAPRAYCKHRIARLLYLRAREIAKTFGTDHAQVQIDPAEVPAIDTEPAPEPAPAPAKPKRTRKARAPVLEPIPAVVEAFTVQIHSKAYRTVAGLMHDARARGLAGVVVEVVSVSAELAVMRATVTLTDGSQWTDIGDASPSNVASHIKPHFMRMASTRAIGRALRLALGHGEAVAEELAADVVD